MEVGPLLRYMVGLGIVAERYSSSLSWGGRRKFGTKIEPLHCILSIFVSFTPTAFQIYFVFSKPQEDHCSIMFEERVGAVCVPAKCSPIWISRPAAPTIS